MSYGYASYTENCGGTEELIDSEGYEYSCEGCEDCEAKIVDWDFVVRLEGDDDKEWLGQDIRDMCNRVNERLDEIEKSGDLFLVDEVVWWVEINLKALPYIAGDIYRDRVDYDGDVEDDTEIAVDDAIFDGEKEFIAMLDRVNHIRERAGLDALPW